MVAVSARKAVKKACAFLVCPRCAGSVQFVKNPAHSSMLRRTSTLILTRLATTTIRVMAAIDSSGCAGEFYADGTYQRGARLRLGLVRHGESMNNVHEAQGTYKTGRVADPELSPRGRRQA